MHSFEKVSDSYGIFSFNLSATKFKDLSTEIPFKEAKWLRATLTVLGLLISPHPRAIKQETCEYPESDYTLGR